LADQQIFTDIQTGFEVLVGIVQGLRR
jgi:hypothetical protein